METGICEFSFFGLFHWGVHVGNSMPVDSSIKDIFFLCGDSGIIAELVAAVLLFPVTEGTKGVGAQGNVMGSSLPG